MRVVHVISALYQGGAETQLEKLIYYSQTPLIEHIVISLKNDETPLMIRLRSNGIQVYCAGFNGIGSVFGFFKLRKLLKRLVSSTSVVQCWMYHANFFGLLAGKSLGISKKVVLNIRRTELPKGITGILAKLSAKLSYLIPVNIVCCAEAAKESHIEAGYDEQQCIVIHNGLDTELYIPDEKKRRQFRHLINVGNHEFVIGMVARYAPIKGHVNLLKALNKLVTDPALQGYNIKLVLIGRGVKEAGALQPFLTSPELKMHIIILNEQYDIWNVMPSFDLFCLPSESEGFPNVVAEAMSCGVPSIVTDVGDAALIVNAPDMVVPPLQPKALACQILKFIQLPLSDKRALSFKARGDIQSRFTVERSWSSYQDLYTKIIECYK